ncbi:voltage-gated chloride channel TMC4-like [Panulirus ornatus]|uniref:voltage-gated chloride channel TMC4-like n=1 Tax=Panulirus ornatus TaxID=150431 RepID=UPI003A89470B
MHRNYNSLELGFEVKMQKARLLTVLRPDKQGRHVFKTPDETVVPHGTFRPHDPAPPPAPNLTYFPPAPAYPLEAPWQLTPELSVKDAAEELRRVRRLQAPLNRRRCQMMHLKQVFKVGAGRAWEARPPVVRLVRDSGRACRRVVDNLQMPGYFLSHISGRYGASGVAVFNLMKDLIHLNLLLSLVLCSWLVAPALYQTKVLGQPLASVHGWITQHDPSESDRCPHVTTTNNNVKVVNCSSIYLETLVSDSIQSWNKTWWVLELLLGEGRFEHSLLFLGHYPVMMLHDTFPTAAVQLLAVVAVFLASLVMVVSRTGQWLRYNSSVWGGLTFSKIVFTSWDFSLRHKRSVTSKRRMLATAIRAALDEHDFQRSKSERTRTQLVELYATRVAVNCLILLAVSLGCFVIILVTNYRENIEELVYDLPLQEIWQRETLISIVRYLDTLVVWLLGLVLPSVLSSLGSLEQYSSRVTMLLFILRSACVRLVSLGVLVASNLSLVGSDSSDDCRPDIPCWETTLAQNLYSQVVWDFIVRVVTTALLLTQRLLSKFICNKTLLEFDVPSRVLDILSLQTILWLSVPVSPLVPVLVLASLYFMLWLEMLVALLVTKPSRHVFQVSQSSAMFMVVLAVSWVGAAATTVVVFAFVRPSLGCGPFRGLTVAWDALTHYICNLHGSATWLRRILFALDNLEVTVSVGIVLLLATFYYLCLLQLRLTVVKRLEKQLKKISHEKLHLMKRLKKLRDHQSLDKGYRDRHRLRY